LEKTLLIDFNGIVHYETIGELIHQFKIHVHNLGIHIGTYKKVLLVMIETLENIMKYGPALAVANTAGFPFMPAFSVVREGERFAVQATNALKQDEVPELEKRLAYLNTLTAEEIKELYKATITNGMFSHKGGAGLGLIEMAKISGNRIDYTFDPIDDTYSVFRMRVVIDEFPAYPGVTRDKKANRA
jgi:hypothetical protein